MNIRFKRILNITVSAALAVTFMVPSALAKTASSAVNNIDDSITAIKDLKTSSTSYDSAGDFSSSSASSNLDTFFTDLGSNIDDATQEVKSISGTITADDLTNVEDAQSRLKSAISRIETTIDGYITSGTTLQTSFDTQKRDLRDNELDDFNTAVENLSNKVNGTTTGTTSTTVNNVINNIDDAITAIKDLRTENDAINSSSTLESFFTDVADQGDEVVSQLKKLTGSLSATDYDSVTSEVSSFNDQVDKQFKRLSDRIAASATGSTLNGLSSDFSGLKRDYRDNQKDDISKQLDRILHLATGVSSGSSLVNSTVSDIEDFQTDVKDQKTTDASSVNTVDEETTYFEDLIDIVDSVTAKVKRITGTITQNDFDDLDNAVSDFKAEVTRTRDAVKTYCTSSTCTTEFNNQKSDLRDALDDLDTAMSNVENLIGTLNTSTGNTTFFDVYSSSEFAPYISALASRGIVTGYSDHSFHPKNFVTRAEFLKIALLAAGKNISIYQNSASTFVDVPLSHSLRPYINYATANGIVNGQILGTSKYFYPERQISRAEAVIILMRINGIAPSSATVSRFTDVRNAEQIRYVEVAATRGIINGYSPTAFGPNDFITREQAAKIVAKMNKLAS